MVAARSETLESAIGYARSGWSVVPLVRKGKRPIVRWTLYQHERADEATIRQWLLQWPDANIGIITGFISGLVVLDVDTRHGGDDSLSDLERHHEPLPKTVEAVTGGGGKHIYFLHPGGIVRNKVGLAPGIDLRGDGGLEVGRLWEIKLSKTDEWIRAGGTGSAERVGVNHEPCGGSQPPFQAPADCRPSRRNGRRPLVEYQWCPRPKREPSHEPRIPKDSPLRPGTVGV